MVILLVSTFTFFGVHTILWFPKAFQERKRIKALIRESENTHE